MKISIEGNIGCGKTTVISKINECTRLPIFLEPVHEWKDWLSLFYSDPKRWGMTFNLNVLHTFQCWKNNNFKAIYERSPMSCRYVFAELQYMNGHINEMEMKLFHQLFKELSWFPDVIIYIKADPKVCEERMKKRNRDCEQQVQLEYLQKVHDNHESLLDKARARGIQIHVVDGNKDAEAVFKDVLDILDTLNQE